MRKGVFRIMLPFGIALALFTLIAPAPAAAIPQPPHIFYGAVNIDGRPAADGTTVTATIAGATFPYTVSAQTSGGNYGYGLLFRVPADNAETSIKEGGVNGDTIVFYVNGISAGNYTFEVGQVTQLDLSITTIPATGRKSLPDPSTFAMVGSGLAVFLLYIGLSALRRRLSRS